MPYHRGSELARIYAQAKQDGYGFIASNSTHPDIMVGLVNGAVSADSDAVLQIKRDTATYIGNGNPRLGVRVLGTYLEGLGDDVDIGVFLNVDHAQPDEMDFIEACIDSGLPSSVMVDASAEAFEENVTKTKQVVDMIEDRGADMLVEAELGQIKGTEGGIERTEAYYTDPYEAVEFVDRTGCDLLAVSIGTEHGVSKGTSLELRPELANEINQRLVDHGIDIPLVVHGSSGLSPDQVRELLTTGVCKLNTNTRYQYEYARTALEYYREHEAAIRPPDGVADDRDQFFADVDWSPKKAEFNPQIVGAEIRDRISTVMSTLADRAGSAGHSLYA